MLATLLLLAPLAAPPLAVPPLAAPSLTGIGQRSPDDLPSPPAQPEAGPGGAEYRHASVTQFFESGKNAPSFYLFEPTQPPPAALSPIVCFLHGFGADDPAKYGAWIDHMVRRGRIVVYPLYQAAGRALPRPETFLDNAVAALSSAMDVLQNGEHAAPDLARVAFVGHGTGGVLAADLAALSGDVGLPRPGAVFAVEPGSAMADRFAGRSAGGPQGIEHADLSAIPPGTLLLTLAGDADSISGETEARRIYLEATSVSAEDKDYLVLHSDAHGRPTLDANHLAPMARDSRFKKNASYADDPRRALIDALDYYGIWKLCDALCDAAFDGTHREFALGNTPEQRFMGHWSDGRAVTEIVVRDLQGE